LVTLLKFRHIVRRFILAPLDRRTPEWSPREGSGSTLVFSPHYDDETLGAGGAILKLRQLGAPVYIIFMTDGSRSHAQSMDGIQLSALRHQEGLSAAAVLGVEPDRVRFLEYPEQRLAGHRDEAIGRVAGLLTELRCERVFVPSTLEPLIWSADHLVTTDVVFEALQRTGKRIEVMEYLVWFWYHWPWVPALGGNDTRQLLKLSWQNRFGTTAWRSLNAAVSLDPFRARKREALAEHRTQTTRMVSDKSWPILADVAQGEFLENFFGSREWFKTYTYHGP
jgi:LmbE family N-acetylglucosaminyl deacetylase